jgi:hypothetical protein
MKLKKENKINIGKIIYSSSIEKANELFKKTFFVKIIELLLIVVIFVEFIYFTIDYYIKGNDDIFTMILMVFFCSILLFFLIKKQQDLYNLELYIVGENGVIINNKNYLSGKISEKKVFLFSNVITMKEEEYFDYGMGPSFLKNINYIEKSYYFYNKDKKIIHKEKLVYDLNNDINKVFESYKGEYLETLLKVFERYMLKNKNREKSKKR